MSRRSRAAWQGMGRGLFLATGLVLAGLAGALAVQWSRTPSETRLATTRDCADADPCTIDFWHEFQEACVHVPDPFCTKACNTDADCAFEDGLAPCMQATCETGQCSYVELAAADCARCESDSDCPQDFCTPRSCEAGFCRAHERSCDDDDPSTLDRCSTEDGACNHMLVDAERACAVDQDCATEHPCEQLTCEAGLCRVTPATAGCSKALDRVQRCEVNTDCIDASGDVCVAGPCEEGFCQWREVPNSPDCAPCEGDHQCDGSFCQWPVCTGTVCVVEEVPFCQDRNPNTADVCSEALETCLHPWIQTPPACTAAPEDDGDAGTVDLCMTATGETVHLEAGDAPCETPNRCIHGYVGPDGWCLGEEVTCLDDDACPATCDPDVGCVIEDDSICACTADADCDLGSPCSRVICMGEAEGQDKGVGGACWGTLVDNCVPCEVDGDCRVDDWCIGGTCADNGYCDYEPLRTCDDGDPSTVGFCHGHKDDWCSFEPHVQTMQGAGSARGCLR